MPNLEVSGTETLDNVLCFFRQESFRQRHMRNGNAAQTKSAVADAASQVDVPFAMSCVIVFTDAVFLHTRTVIDAVQQMGVAQ